MKHYKILFVIAGLFLLGLFATAADAQQINPLDIPRTISYQGLLTSTDGTPLPDGTHTITVTLYGDENGRESLWHDSYQAATTNGIFSLYLGSNHPLPSSSEMNRPLWVGTSVDEEKEMFPLTALTSSPYALNLPDRAVTTGKLADGAVTADKVEMDYVKGFRVNGQEISGKGTVLDIRGGNGIALDYDEANNVLNVSRGTEARTGDAEKERAEVLATNNEVWTLRGNSRTLAAGFPAVAPGAGDYIGTNNAVTFELRTNNQIAMRYQPNGVNTPNVLGGHNSNSIGNGVGNVIAGGGRTANANKIEDLASYGSIGGGEANVIKYRSDWGTIGGGLGHWIDTNADYSTISGGLDNTIYPNSVDSTSAGTIGGGGFNVVRGYYGTIAGGNVNEVVGHFSFIGGGDSNYISVSSDLSSIVGGKKNRIGTSTWALIGGGSRNWLDSVSNWSLIGGGDSNHIYGQLGFIGGGFANVIEEFNGTIGGGRSNNVLGNTGTIGGGYLNLVEAEASTIGGGQQSAIDPNATYATVGGGLINIIEHDAIQGTIGGGARNTIEQNAAQSTIGGGSDNVIHSSSLFTLTHATIPGGDNLIAQSWAQTVIGGFNEAKGNVTPRYSGGGDLNSPIFIIGNGPDTLNRRNAFEVSYTGHSIVFDENGTGGATTGSAARGAVRGGTYTDNVIYGWAEVTATGQVRCDDFGIDTITTSSAGVFVVTLNPVGPDGVTPYHIDCGAAVATLSSGADPGQGEPFCMAFISTSAIKDNVFEVYTSQYNSSTGQCQPINLPFKFHVTGRPHP